jgi:hypothetical protein
MFPLDAIYGPLTYRRFDQDKMFKGGLKSTLQSSREADADRPLAAGSYTELVDIVSFLSIMNKRHTLYFRGQASNWPLRPTAFRPIWTSLNGTRHSIPNDPAVLQEIWDHLNGPIASIVLSACDGLPMPRPATLRMFREAVWAVAQHYELWPTPLIDITPSLRVAASFALWGGQPSGYLYVAALPPSTNSVTFDADQHVCWPVSRLSVHPWQSARTTRMASWWGAFPL